VFKATQHSSADNMLPAYAAWQQLILAALLAGHRQQQPLLGVVLVQLYEAGLGNRFPNLSQVRRGKRSAVHSSVYAADLV
jgi:hypothetical protein